MANCTTQGCVGTCFVSCSNGCDHGCGGNCSMCETCGTSQCQGSCRGDCDGGCSGCGSSCSTDCSGSCSGGCVGCSASCRTDCSGSCSGGCVGCSASCRHDCSACTGNCTGGCDNGCTTSANVNLYNSISLRIVLYAADIANIYTMLNKELSRRGYSTLPTKVSSNSKVNTNLKNEIFTNISKMQNTSYNGNVCTKSEMQKAITALKSLYSKILKS